MRPSLSSQRKSFIILASVVALAMTLPNYASTQRKKPSISYQQLTRIKLEGDLHVHRVTHASRRVGVAGRVVLAMLG
jgi:hypothetical protein